MNHTVYDLTAAEGSALRAVMAQTFIHILLSNSDSICSFHGIVNSDRLFVKRYLTDVHKNITWLLNLFLKSFPGINML